MNSCKARAEETILNELVAWRPMSRAGSRTGAAHGGISDEPVFLRKRNKIAYHDTAESANDAPLPISRSFRGTILTRILRTGGNADEARMKIAAEFSKQSP